jgi:predicted nucleic acid-binding protein
VTLFSEDQEPEAAGPLCLRGDGAAADLDTTDERCSHSFIAAATKHAGPATDFDLWRYLLDTSIIVGLLRRRLGSDALHALAAQRETATTASSTRRPVSAGFPIRAHRRRSALRDVHPSVFTYQTFDRYGEIRRALRPLNQMIGDIDTLIAATALERTLTVVTLDQDYQRVPGLSVHLLTRADLA